MDNTIEWVVIGAGPAGIAAVGGLLDCGVDGQRIRWIDPKFCVGDFGTLWRHVLSNTPAESFLKYCRTNAAFKFDNPRDPFFLERIPQDKQCPLKLAAQPLEWITAGLKPRVQILEGEVTRLTPLGRAWLVTLASGETFGAQKVVLAMGAEPKRLQYPDLAAIPLPIALDPNEIGRHVKPTDRLALFGDAQSAKSVLVTLKNIQFQKLYHFYHSESSVRRHIAVDDLAIAESLPTQPGHLIDIIPHCDKAIYAIGFERRPIRIDGLPDDFDYDRDSGIVAPGIYGLGIAFPEIMKHVMGKPEFKVTAIEPMIKGLRRRLPNWLRD